MKIKRILAVPFAVVADVVSLGNMGERSFTQQVFDAEKRESRFKEDKEAIETIAKLIKALKD